MSLTRKYDFYTDEVECDICGVGPLEEVAEVVCSTPDPSLDGTFRQNRYERAWIVLKLARQAFQIDSGNMPDGSKKGPERRRKKYGSSPGVTYADIVREHEEREEERRRADVQRMNNELGELRANWPEYQFTVKPRQQKL